MQFGLISCEEIVYAIFLYQNTYFGVYNGGR